MANGIVFELVIGTHFFRLQNISYTVRGILTEFCGLYTKMEYQQAGEQKGKYLPGKTFVSIRKDFNEYRFHINQLGHFLQFMKSKGIRDDSIAMGKKKDFEAADIEMRPKSHWKLRPLQEKGRDLVNSDGIPGKSRMLAIATGSGKALQNGTLVKVPGGFKKIETLKVGDEITAPDGTDVLVLGVYPQGVTDMYELTFSDGRKVRASSDHLWTVHGHNWKAPGARVGGDWRTLTTAALIPLLEKHPKRFRVPLCTPDQRPRRNFPLDPYLVGLLIGDGNYSGSGIRFTKKDSFFESVFDEVLPSDCTYVRVDEKEWRIVGKKKGTNSVSDWINKLGMRGARSWQKTIPEIYMNGSTAQRLALVQGLLDSDGEVEHNGGVSFTTTSEKLADQFRELIWSLGGICSMSSRITKYTYKGVKLEGRRSWRLHVRAKNQKDLFRLPRKRDKLKDENQYSKGLKLGIRSIVRVDDAESTCISVDHPDKLFLAEGYVATHNTASSMVTLMDRGKRIMVCVLAKYMKKWVSDVEGIGNNKKIMTISGSKDLKSVLEMAQDDPDSLPDIFVASLTTMTNWFKQYEEMEIEADAYGCHPEDYCKTLGLGAVLVDEAHEHLNSVWSLMSYSHVERFVGLSGTFLSEDRFIEMIQNIMFPQETRFDEIKMGKYINVYAITFDVDNFKEQRIRTTTFGSNSYSHAEFEKSISRNKAFLRTYLKFIEDYVREGYDKRAQDGDKCIVYASTIDMCGIICDHLKKAFPRRDVRKYVDTDKSYDDIIEAEIKVSTPGSAGTALDMPGLISVFSHYCVSSPVQNIQMLGRLRDLEGKEMRYYYFHCNQIPKQIEYHKKRMALYADRSKKILDLKHPQPLKAEWKQGSYSGNVGNFNPVKRPFSNFSTRPGEAPANRMDPPRKRPNPFWKERGSKFRVGRSW